jgi:hypothetical protein
LSGVLYKRRIDAQTTSFEEYFQPKLEFEVVDGKPQYFVREKHGYYSDTEKRPIHVITTLSPEEGYAIYGEALVRYQQQVDRRVKDGFVHSYSIDPYKSQEEQPVYEYLGK